MQGSVRGWLDARVVVVLLLGLALLAPVGVSPAIATVDAGRDRIAGVDRIATAAAVAREAFPQGTDQAVLARADVFADAIAAGGLAGALGAPVLLTSRDQLPDVTLQALRDLGVANVSILGGDAAVGPAVRRALDDAGIDWVRHQGQDRYDTAAQAAVQVAASGGIGTLGGRTTVLLASGTRFPDGLAASPVAYAGPFPILLTEGTRLSAFTAAALDELAPGQVVILGGPTAVASSVADEVRALGIRVRRVAGPTRTDTAAAIADLAVDELGFAATEAVVVRGDAFPDALTAGPYGGERQAPVLLTPTPGMLGSAAAAWVSDRCESIAQVTAVGGRVALDEAVLDAAEREARECGFQVVVPYFVLGPRARGDAGLAPVARQAPAGAGPLAAALEALLDGPSDAEAGASPALATAIPAGTVLNDVAVSGGIATVDLSEQYDDGGGTSSMLNRLAQVVYTATRFPNVDGVLFELDGDPVEVFSSEGIVLDGPQTRADHTEQLPNLFVDDPPYGGWLGNPARIAGIASVFEAQFEFEIRDAVGTVVAAGPIMGSDQVLGTFAERVDYAVDTRQQGRLRVFNRSARDGSIENVRVHPVELTPASGG